MTEIVLNTNVENLREIYFGTGNHKYFFGPTTKKESAYLVLVLISYPFFALKTFNLKNRVTFILLTILVGIQIYSFIKAAKPIIKWKREVNDFLQKSSRIQVIKVIYTDDYFLHQQDEMISKVDWNEITHAIIQDNLIEIFNESTNFMLPKKSMSESEFELLSNTVMEKVKNVNKN